MALNMSLAKFFSFLLKPHDQLQSNSSVLSGFVKETLLVATKEHFHSTPNIHTVIVYDGNTGSFSAELDS